MRIEMKTRSHEFPKIIRGYCETSIEDSQCISTSFIHITEIELPKDKLTFDLHFQFIDNEICNFDYILYNEDGKQRLDLRFNESVEYNIIESIKEYCNQSLDKINKTWEGIEEFNEDNYYEKKYRMAI